LYLMISFLVYGFSLYSKNIMILQSKISLKQPYIFYIHLNTRRPRILGNCVWIQL